MKKKWWFAALLGFTLAVALYGCAPHTPPTSLLQSGLYQVVRVGNKELTLGAPTLLIGHYANLVTVVVKNTGAVPVTLAELEIIHLFEYPPGHAEEEKGRVVIKGLSPGHVQTIYWEPGKAFTHKGQVWVKVVDIK